MTSGIHIFRCEQQIEYLSQPSSQQKLKEKLSYIRSRQQALGQEEVELGKQKIFLEKLLSLSPFEME